MKERYQILEDKNAEFRQLLLNHKLKAQEFMETFEMSWVYHDNAVDGTVYAPAELNAALRPGAMAAEALLLPIVLDIRNYKHALDYIRDEAKATALKKNAGITLTHVKRIHDLMAGNTPEAQVARAAAERRERSEKELAREREKFGYRKEMPLHRTYLHEIAQPAKIPALLEKMVDWTSTAEYRDLNPIQQAARIQYQFVQIFPFIEHSGKVGRCLSNLILLRAHMFPVVINAIDRQKYYEAFRGSAATFSALFMDAMDVSLKNATEYFQKLGRV